MTTELQRRDWLPSLGRLIAGQLMALAAPALAVAYGLARPRVWPQLASDFRLMTRSLERDQVWPLALVVLCAFLALIVGHPFPADDLARDITVQFYGYDYNRMFWGSPLMTPFNGYWLFDRLGPLVNALPTKWQPLPFQLIPLAVTLWAVGTAMSRDLRGTANRWVLAAFLLALLLMQCAFPWRYVEGRPEIWFTAWFCTALVLPAWLWFGIGLAITPMYWFAPVYGCGALLLRGQSLRFRLVLAAFFGFCSVVIWLGLTDGQFLKGMLDFRHAYQHHTAGPVWETDTVWNLIVHPWLWALLALLWYFRDGIDRRQDAGAVLALAVFLAPNMARYLSNIDVALVVLLARAVARSRKTLPVSGYALRWIVAGIALFAIPGQFGGGRAPTADLLARAQPGDRVLAAQGHTLFRAVFAGARRGAVFAPAMDYGMNTPEVQQLSLALTRGQGVDCDALRRLNVRWVVENGLKGRAPDCLALDSFDAEMRVWAVVDHPPT